MFDADRFLMQQLHGRLWHSTHPERFLQIVQSGAILPEPTVPDYERWKTERGQDYFPYVRSIGGVSLFDFHEFDPESYLRDCPVSNWYEFVPYRKDWGAAVWIEIDRKRIGLQFISAGELLQKWKAEEAYRHTIMPRLEAAHIGALSAKAFKRALFVHSDASQLSEFDLQKIDPSAYEERLNEWRSTRSTTD